MSEEMVRVNVAEIEGSALDFAVAICEGYDPQMLNTKTGVVYSLSGHYAPTVDWARGGVIIGREKIGLLFRARTACRDEDWFATPDDQDVVESYEGESFDATFMVNAGDGFFGPTALVAAMRCYVNKKMGPVVDVRADLVAAKPASGPKF